MEEIDTNSSPRQVAASFAAVALDSYGQKSGQSAYDYGNASCLLEIAAGLISRVGHLCDTAGLRFGDVLRVGAADWAYQRVERSDPVCEAAADEEADETEAAILL